MYRIAVIGCGAVTERCHMRALRRDEDCEVVALVDTDEQRAKELAEKFEVPEVFTDSNDVIGRVDAAILALPHHLHAPISTALLREGIHVLVEKPMAMTTDECRSMLEAAKAGGAVLAVGLIRRFLHVGVVAKEIIETRMLGEIESFDFREGNVYNWPVSSDFFWNRESAGGGVLFDTGAHTLDQLLWWLGDVKLLSYRDDSFDGVEADCEIELTTSSGVTGFVDLSRTRDLRNTAIIRCERGSIEIDLRKNEAKIIPHGGSSSLVGYGLLADEEKPAKAAKQGFADLFPAQLRDWLQAISTGRSPRAGGEEAMRSVALIEQCYRNKVPLVLPWTEALIEENEKAKYAEVK